MNRFRKIVHFHLTLNCLFTILGRFFVDNVNLLILKEETLKVFRFYFLALLLICAVPVFAQEATASEGTPEQGEAATSAQEAPAEAAQQEEKAADDVKANAERLRKSLRQKRPRKKKRLLRKKLRQKKMSLQKRKLRLKKVSPTSKRNLQLRQTNPIQQNLQKQKKKKRKNSRNLQSASTTVFHTVLRKKERVSVILSIFSHLTISRLTLLFR